MCDAGIRIPKAIDEYICRIGLVNHSWTSDEFFLRLAAALMTDDLLTCGAIVKENPTRVEVLLTDLRADLHVIRRHFSSCVPRLFLPFWPC